jgi:hypothetical protein
MTERATEGHGSRPKLRVKRKKPPERLAQVRVVRRKRRCSWVAGPVFPCPGFALPGRYVCEDHADRLAERSQEILRADEERRAR